MPADERRVFMQMNSNKDVGWIKICIPVDLDRQYFFTTHFNLMTSLSVLFLYVCVRLKVVNEISSGKCCLVHHLWYISC